MAVRYFRVFLGVQFVDFDPFFCPASDTQENTQAIQFFGNRRVAFFHFVKFDHGRIPTLFHYRVHQDLCQLSLQRVFEVDLCVCLSRKQR